jgi:o-succinylbenzoate synthase
MVKVVKFNIYKYCLPLQSEFRISFSATSYTEGLIVEAFDENGRKGYGESSPSSKIVGTTTDSALGIIRKIAGDILARDLSPWEAYKQISSSVIHNGDAKAAIEGAILDLYCQEINQPVYKCLGGYRDSFITDMTIGIKSLDETLMDVQKYLEEGFTQLKIKVGEGPEKDVSKIKAIRERFGYDFVLRVDANQGWTFKQALKIAKELEKYEIELIEQPLKYWDLRGIKALRNQTSIPIAVDESVHTAIDAINIIREDVADVINIKIMKAGGILEGLKISLLSESAGIKNMIGCMLETRLGITMAAHLVGLTENIVYIDLDSDLSLRQDPVKGGVEHLGGGKRKIPNKPGFGVVIDKSQLQLVETIEQGRASEYF